MSAVPVASDTRIEYVSGAVLCISSVVNIVSSNPFVVCDMVDVSISEPDPVVGIIVTAVVSFVSSAEVNNVSSFEAVGSYFELVTYVSAFAVVAAICVVLTSVCVFSSGFVNVDVGSAGVATVEVAVSSA